MEKIVSQRWGMFLRCQFIIGALLFLSMSQLKGQVSCPPNIDFEQGNLSNWLFYTGTCCPINTPTLSGAVFNRHVLTSGTALDPYGGFPVVAPGGGTYSLKLGNNGTSRQAERARYFVRVPTGTGNYSLIYRYAVVFQNPGHTAADQPRFEVRAFDSATGLNIPCAQFSYVSSSTLPGFQLAPVGGQVYYRSWSSASIDLSGQGGKTIAVDFASGDCDLGGHFGYGYLDLNCSLFQIVSVNCNNAPTTTLTAPPGFQTYQWYNAGFSLVGTGQTVVIPTPPITTQYHVVLTPFTGYGCPDTLTTTVSVSSLNVNATNDTFVCSGNPIQLSAGASGTSTVFNYSWSPAAGLSCTNCANPIATPSTNRTYYVTVTDGNGCVKTDSIRLTIGPLAAASTQNVSCYGGNNGAATILPAQGQPPYTYSWNTNPVQTSAMATGLSSGVFSGVVTDVNGCKDTVIVNITEPALLLPNGATAQVACFAGATGSASVQPSGGVPPYSIAWNTVPVQTTGAISGLTAGSYIANITDSNGCTASDTLTVLQPTALASALALVTSVTCFGGTNGSATASVSGGTPPYSYAWNTNPVQTSSTATGLAAGNYLLIVTDSVGCVDTLQVAIAQPAPLVATASSSPVLCRGENTGSTAVTVTGGTTPYVYLWNTMPVQTTAATTNIPAGAYSVLVTDSNGCTATASVNVLQPSAALSAMATVSGSVFCYGAASGALNAAATGGTAPYAYAWNTTPVQTTPAAIGLTAGAYTVTVTDSNGCTDTASAILQQPDSLALVATATDVSCYAAGNGTATVSASGGTAPYSIAWNTVPAQMTTTINGLAPGVYTATVTDDNGCVKSAVVSISQPPVLSMVPSGITQVKCFGGTTGAATVATTGGIPPYTYSWNTTPVQTTATAANLSAGSYTVIVTDTNGCIRADTISITQPLPLQATRTVLPVSCFGGATGSASVSVSGGTPGYSFSWNTSPIQTGSGIANVVAGTYIVTITDSNLCARQDTLVVTQPPVGLSVTASVTNAITCHNASNGAALAAAAGGTAPYSYSWSTTPAQSTAAATGLPTGSYTVTVVDANNCTAATSVTLSAPSPLSAAATSTPATCFGVANGSASVVATGGTTPYSFSWNTSPVQTTGIATGLPAGNYTATITDANGCVITANTAVSQPAQLFASITAKADVSCFGLTDGTATAAATGGTAPYTFQWNSSPIQATPTATALGAGIYSVTVTDSQGCTAATQVNIAGALPITTTFGSVTDVLCYGAATGSATINVSGGKPPYGLLWNTNPPQTGNQLSGVAAGSYTVQITDSNGCTQVDTVTISQPAELKLATGSSATCSGFSNGSAYLVATGGVAPYAFSWTGGQTNDTITGINSGSYGVTVTDANNCSISTSVLVPNFPSPVVSVGPDRDLCAGKSLQLVATGAQSYSWTPTTGLSCTNCSNPTVSVLSDILYVVVGTDDNNCSDTDDIAIRVIQRAPVFVGDTKEICAGATTELSASGGTSYGWHPAALVDNPTLPNPVARPDVSTVFYVVVRQNDCFTDTLRQMVVVHPLPTIDLGPDLTGVAGARITLNAAVSNASDIAWTPATNLSCADCFSPVATLVADVTYVATVFNELGCKASDDVSIRVTCDNSSLFVPNTFTPNGDGNNDWFYASGDGISLIKRLVIYNRWGQLVFEATNIPPNDQRYGWDGTMKGEKLPTDVFV